jgi:DNA-binding IclR family transcriptional regulator
MATKAETVALTESEAACLQALRNNPGPKTRLAVAAKLDLKNTSRALERLARLGLIERDERKRWHVSQHGQDICFETIPDRKRRNSKDPGASARRLLKALDSPMHVADLAERLDLTRQRVHQLAVKLHAFGLVRFSDQGRRFSLIARKDDPTELLSKDEERILSAVSVEYPTSTSRIRSAARLTTERARDALMRLLALGLVEEETGPGGEKLYGLTETGLAHPQRNKFTTGAEPPRLPVKSDRVLAVLSYISDEGQVRIKDVAQALRLPGGSTNALFQYLKRRSLVRKSAQELNAPYELTEKGRQVLAELRRRGAALL